MNPANRSEQYLTLFRAALGQSARDGEALLRQVFLAARGSLEQDFNRAPGPVERAQLGLCVKLLDENAPLMCAGFPALLRQAFQDKQIVSSQFGELAMGELSHSQLERMDESEVQERVELARVLQTVQGGARPSLNELSAFMSSLQGLSHVKPDRNPLRPQIYLSLLQEMLVHAELPVQVRISWMRHLAVPLGVALGASYAALGQRIKSYGVEPLRTSTVTSPPLRPPGRSAGPAQLQRSGGDVAKATSVLTLDRLRQLLATQAAPQQNVAPDEAVTQFSGELDWNSGPAEMAPTPALEEPTTDFASTVPAAFEALQNMNQADDVIARLSQPSLMDKAHKPESAREKLRKSCQSPAQVLSFEVMVQMIDNLINDTRLVKGIRDVIENLEPALLRLVLVDVRFFNNKQHPARRLLQEITERGLAFGSADSPECALFIRSLHRYVNPLSRIHIDSAEPFDLALYNLSNMWSEQLVQSQQTVQQAMRVLNRAEERNLLAEKICAAMAQIPDMQRVPAPVVDFLCGPWCQVMAAAELNNTEHAEDPGGYKGLVKLLLWSAQPELTRQDLGKLTKLVSKLLSKLREGLSLIDYPSVKTSLFFDALMKLHQQAFRPASEVPASSLQTATAKLLGNHHKLWLAPEEAKASGFMDMADDDTGKPLVLQPSQVRGPLLDSVIPMASQAAQAVPALTLETLTVGAWVEIAIKGVWQRSQLSWISPQRTMYLFTGAQGQTQSMTRPSLENLIVTNAMRLVSDHSMVDGALDEVVHTAMLNSLDSSPT
ncbi:DUF1631 family protein [Rhodoferax sp.]|uniref:DUF1631 family protein n=1 Tax=Rhodoferax sp. TaxID=50421 RepID=UPI002732F799|nr:DUF1631 family protein [Rhodoferax sp.]MDP3193036.1 DUF1631 family protein [Rhodoferax sp.]MDP3335931.1 DUF1631 family protein [Rhodoferax sp.]